MTPNFESIFSSLEASRPNEESNDVFESPEDFWAAARSVPFIGDPASLMRYQFNALRNDHLYGARTTIPLQFLGSASQRSVENYLYPESYRPRERQNHGERRSVRRGSGPGAGNIFRERKDWDEVTVVPYENGLGNICGFSFMEGNCHVPTDVVHKPIRGCGPEGREGGLAMLAAAHRRPFDSLRDCLFVMLDLVSALRIQFRWLKSQTSPLPLVVPRHDDRQQTRAAWKQLPPSRRILLTNELTAADIYQARLADAKIAVCPHLIQRMLGFGLAPLLLRKSIELAKRWQSVLRETLRHKPAAEARELFDGMEWPMTERAKFLDRIDDDVKRQFAVWFPDVFAPRAVIGHNSVIEKEGNWIDEGSGAIISPAIRVVQLLHTSFGTEKVDGHVTIGGRPHDFRLSMANIEQVGLLAAVRRSLRTKGVSMSYKSGWSHRSWELANALSSPQTVKQADVVGCDGHDFRFPRFGITFSGFSFDEATPLPPRIRPADKLQPPPDLHTFDLGRVSSATPGVGLFWAVLRIFVLYSLAPRHRQQLPACVLLGDQAKDLADTIANSFDALRFTAPGRVDADTAFRKLATLASRHTWPSIISLPTRAGDVSSRLLNALPTEQTFIAAPELQLSDIRGRRYWSIQVQEFDDAQRLIEDLGLPVLLHYLKDIKSRQGNYEDWSEDWKICAWKDLGIWFGRLSRSREARNQCDKLIHFNPE